MNGFFLVNKPANGTSYDIIRLLKKKFNFSSFGHFGTLDPFAQGLLIIGAGHSNKLFDLFRKKKKYYNGIMEFGILTDTLDNTGTVLSSTPYILNKVSVDEVCKKFTTKYMQTPPKYSAVKVDGKRAYDMARNNEEFNLTAKEVTIYELSLNITDDNHIYFETCVSSGTYIRSLVDDIARSLGTVGILTKLVRTQIGEYKLQDAHFVDDLTSDNLIEEIDFFHNSKKEVISDPNTLKEILNGTMKLSFPAIKSNDFIAVTKDEKPIAYFVKEDNVYNNVYWLNK